MAGNGVKIRIDGDASGFKSKLTGIGEEARRVFSGVGKAANVAVSGLKTIVSVVGTAGAAMGAASVKYLAGVEQLETSFEVMTGSADKAADVMERLRKLGAETPFETTDLAETTQLLMQYGMDADTAIDRMTMLGDISQGSADKMQRIATAYGQMSSAGKVQLEDVKQLIEAGFNPLLEISERTGESMASLYDRISDGTLTVDEITQSMIASTSEGGKFFQSMEKQSQTLNGQLSTLQDNLQELGGDVFADVFADVRDNVLPEANELIAGLQAAFDVGGLDGLINEFSVQLPRLISEGTRVASEVIDGIAKKMPGFMKNLMSVLPNVIKSAAALAPSLTDAFFQVASDAIGGVIELMPQWAPALLKGAGNLVLEVGEGLLKIIGTTLGGIVDLANTTADEMWDDLVDKNKSAELAATITGNVDITGAKTAISTATSELSTALGELYGVLTNGIKSDDDNKTLQQRLDETLGADLATVDTWLSTNIGALDTEATTYTANVAALQAQAETYKTELTNLHTAASELVASMVGQPTAVVQAKMLEFDAIQARLDEIFAQMTEVNAAAQTLYVQAFERVRAGASTSEVDIINATEFAYSSFKIDQQAIEDAAAAAKAEADAAWEAGLKSEEDRQAHLRTLEEIEHNRQNEMLALEARYAGQLSEILRGIGEAFAVTEPETMQQISAVFEKINITKQIEDELNAWNPEDPAAIETAKEKIKGLMETLTGEEVMPSDLQYQNIEGFLANFQNVLAEDLSQIEAVDENGTSPVLTIFDSLFNSAAFSGLEIDTSTIEGKITAMMGNVGGVMQAYDFTTDAAAMGKNAQDAAAPAMEKGGEAIGESLDSGISLGIANGESEVIETARRLALNTVSEVRRILGINSPSKVAMELGQFWGEGWEIGLRDSLTRAKMTAVRLMGGISTAADINQNMRVNIPDLSQEIILANEQSQQQVNLFINGKELARVTAADNQTAASWYDRRLAIGRNK